MSTKKTSSYSGAVLRMQRDERMAAVEDPVAQARRYEASFLRNIGAAGEDYAWIIANEAWLRLGFETFTDWYEERVAPLAARLGLRPAREQAKLAIEKAAEEQKALPRDQRRSQRDLARVFGVSQATISRAAGDSNESNGDESPQVSDPLASFPDAEKALEEFHNNQAAGLVDPPVDESGEDHPAGKPGEAEIDHSAADVTTPSAPQTGTASSSEEHGPVDGPERQDPAGVSGPAAPVPPKDEDDPERVNHEMRTRMSERFCESIVTLSRGAASRDPIDWLEDTYLPGAYKMRGLPGVDGCFEPDALRLLAARINMIADHVEQAGLKLP
jgi:hypothetical protein